jgi:hypothetical protein
MVRRSPIFENKIAGENQIIGTLPTNHRNSRWMKGGRRSVRKRRIVPGSPSADRELRHEIAARRELPPIRIIAHAA